MKQLKFHQDENNSRITYGRKQNASVDFRRRNGEYDTPSHLQ